MKFAVRCLIAAALGLAASLVWPGLKTSAEDVPADDPANAAGAPASAAAGRFEREVAPLLARRCLGCHNPEEHKGGLDLTSKLTALAGGENGVVLTPGDPDASELWQRIDNDEMPPKKPLSAAEKSVLRTWIAEGAAWGSGPIDRFRFTSDTRAGYDWWSLAPLRPVPIPQVAGSAWVRNPIDAFVLARLEERSMAPSPPADRRTLIRRLSVDLLGLPPTPEEIDAFVADADPDAYEKLVDRLLASPHYGEHWARHWLDVARFGESDGFEYDVLRPRAWPYRDWVISALNRDLPYDEFARLQIAGDVLHPDDPDAVTATGFLVAGARDNLVPAGEPMRLVMREDEMEDMVGTVAQTFLGLTVNCARCHDHKFDPIRHSEYYRLSSALSGVKHGERDLPLPSPVDLADLQSQLAAVRAELTAIDDPVRLVILAERAAADLARSPPQPIARWNFAKGVQDELGRLEVTLRGSARVDGGGLHLDGKTAYAQSPPLERQLRSKTLEAWVSLANVTQRGGAAVSVQSLDGNQFDAIVFGETEPNRWIVGSDNYRRTQSAGGPEEPAAAADEFVHVAIVYHDDGTIVVYRNGQPYGQSYRSSGPVSFMAGNSQVVFGLRHGPPSEGKLLDGVVRRAQLYDRALSAAEVAESAGAYFQGVGQSQILARLSPDQGARRAQLLAKIASLDAQIHPRPPRVFAVKAQVPLILHRLDRGNPQAPREVVSPGGVKAVAGASADFGLPPDAPDDERRTRLARWITAAENPLFARVMANRVWHYHFGAGIVETPNDLGFNGGRPSHGELLDWLAGEFVRQGFSLKRLHRTIVTSAVYRQASKPNRAALAVDAGNRLLWRYPPRRLDAETVRDAVLLVAGQLTERGGGAGFADFNVFNDRGTQRYEPLDPEGPQFNRRSIYRTWARGGRNPLLDTFDCPDPSVTSPQRGVTTTPLQALVLLNNSFLLRMSDQFGARVSAEAGPKAGDQVRRAYQLAYGRVPTAAESARVESFVEKHGLPALCRVLLNSNEFLYCD